MTQTGCAGGLEGWSTWAKGGWLGWVATADEPIIEAERSGLAAGRGECYSSRLAAGRGWGGVGLTRAFGGGLQSVIPPSERGATIALTQGEQHEKSR